jgi:hypothetical protein
MPEHFIALKCQSCGGNLEIYGDMDRFACGYCGTEMIVQRRGGTVVLKAVTDAIKQVQIGTDKTAAELAIARYEGDLRDLRAVQAKLTQERDKGIGTGVGCGVLLMALGLITVSNSATGFGLTMLALGAIFLAAGFKTSKNPALEQVRAQVRQLEIQISEKKKIADS